MTAPVRWKDSADAPLGARELLSAARPTRAMPDAAFGRGVARVAKTAAAPIAVAAGTTLWVKLAAAGVAVVALAGGVTAAHHLASKDAERDARVTEATSAPAVTPAAPSRPASTSVPEPEPEPAPEPPVPVPVPVPAPGAAPARASASAPASAPAPASASVSASADPGTGTGTGTETESLASPSTLPAELALLERARHSLATDPLSTLSAVREHRARFPSGTLSAERDLLELDALRRSGRPDLARIMADGWLAREPAGVYSARVRAIRDSLPADY